MQGNREPLQRLSPTKQSTSTKMALLFQVLQLLIVLIPFVSPKPLTMATPLVQEPQNQKVTDGGTVTFRCVRNQSQSCSVLWYHMGVQTYLTRDKNVLSAFQVGHYSLDGNNANDFSLTIHNVTTADIGAYQCACLGSQLHYFSPAALLDIVELPLPTPFVEGPQNQNVAIGGTVTFRCIRHQSQSCAVLWYHMEKRTYLTRNENVLSGSKVGRYSINGNNPNDFSLTIHNVAKSDIGTYQCACLFGSHRSQQYFSPVAFLNVVVPLLPTTTEKVETYGNVDSLTTAVHVSPMTIPNDNVTRPTSSDPNTVTMTTPFVEEPQNQNVAIGGTVTFRCVQHQSQSCIVLWYGIKKQTFLARNKNVLSVFQVGHYSLDGNNPNDFSLTIHNVTKADIGAYQCACFRSQQYQEYFSSVAFLNVVVPPLPTTTAKVETYEDVNRLTTAVHVIPITKPNEDVTRPISSDPNTVIMTTPLVEEPQNQNVTVGGTVTFRCVRHQSQSCSVLWYHMDRQTFLTRDKNVLSAFQVGHYSLDGNNANDFSLTIHNVTVTTDDIGAYQCACLGLGSQFQYFSPAALLDIVELPLPTPFVEEPQNQNVAIGGTVTFRCVRHQSQSCTVLWYHMEKRTYLTRNENVLSGSQVGRYSINGNNPNDFSLTIHNVAKSDIGTYQCACLFGSHRSQQYFSPVAFLNIVVPLLPTTTEKVETYGNVDRLTTAVHVSPMAKPNDNVTRRTSSDSNTVTMTTPFVEEPQTQNVAIGGTVTFRCVRHQSQSCIVLWYNIKKQTYLARNKNVLSVFQVGHYLLDGNNPNDFSLTIHNVTKADIGAYQCACFKPQQYQEYFSPVAFLNVVVSPLPTTTAKVETYEDVNRLTTAVHVIPITKPNEDATRPISSDPNTVIMTTPLVQEPQNQNVTVGGTVTFRCVRHQSQSCSVLWYHMDRQTFLTRDKNVLSAFQVGHYSLDGNNANDFSLTIHNVTTADIGAYQCACLESQLHYFSPVALLNVVEPPLPTPFVEEPQNQNVTIGGTVTFRCVRHQSQTCIVLWYHKEKQTYITRNKNVLSSSQVGHYSLNGKNPNDFSLTIHNVAKSDIGAYQCACLFGPHRPQQYFSPVAVLNVVVSPLPTTTEKGKTYEDVDRLTTAVHVNPVTKPNEDVTRPTSSDPDTVIITTPFGVEEPQNQNVAVAGTVTFRCVRHQSQNCTVLWYHMETQTFLTRNKTVLSGSQVGHYSLDGNDPNDFSLTIHNATQADIGAYECVCWVTLEYEYFSLPTLPNVFLPPLPIPTEKIENNEKVDRLTTTVHSNTLTTANGDDTTATSSDPNSVTMTTPFLEEPQNQNVAIGGTVTFRCVRHQSQSCIVLWYNVEKQAYLTRNKNFLSIFQVGHYLLDGNNPNDFSLTIHNITKADIGSYQCACFGPQQYFSPVALLNVVIPPLPTTIEKVETHEDADRL